MSATTIDFAGLGHSFGSLEVIDALSPVGGGG